MARDPQLPHDPLARFCDLYAALNAERGWWNDASPLRFAAVAALSCPGDAGAVAAAIRGTADALKAESGWFGTLTSQLRFVVAALLVLHEDRVPDFLAEVRRVRELFRHTGVRRTAVHETMAILILRLQARQQPITHSVVDQFTAIFQEMKKYHWWLTGPEDLPACALLARHQVPAGEIGAEIESIYTALPRAGCSTGDPLQTAANILYLAGLGPDEAAGRYAALMVGFRAAGVSIWQSDYDELAILTFLDHPAERVIETVLRHREVMKGLRPQPDRLLTFNLAASIAFLELVRLDADLKLITDAKALLDMQAVINNQHAAACSGATGCACS